MEQYKTFFESYEISNLGNCRRLCKSGKYKILKGSKSNRGGYKYIQLNRGGKRTNFYFHEQVIKHFKGERPKGLVIDHINRNPLDNNIDNLRYTTQKQNTINRNVKGGIHTRTTHKKSCATISLNGIRYNKYSENIQELEEWLEEKRSSWNIKFD